MKRIVITGSNRGVGLALVKQYLRQDDTLIMATCRNPDNAQDLQSLIADNPNRIHIIQLDVIDADSIAGAVMTISDIVDGLDMLINNAGILPGGVDNRDLNISKLGQLEARAMLKVFEVNTISPVIVTQAFAELLRQGQDVRVINVSSDAGSIHMREKGCDYSYPSSKAALNMMSRCLAGDLQDDNIIAVSVHPGFIQTDMGGVNAKLTLEQAIPTLVNTIDNLRLADTGQFFNWDGKQVAW
jgi:NAD(P)-dependent dehydrogenase (short-subunit alcohol dehydrogenase family)